MKLKNELNPTSKTLSSIAKSLKKFPQGIQKRFDELGIKGTEYKGRIWYTVEEVGKLKEYLNDSEVPTEYKYSIYDFKKELNRDYGTIKRCIDYLQIKGFTDLHNKTFYNEVEKNNLYEFINSKTSSEIQQILAENTFLNHYGVNNPMKCEKIQNKLKKITKEKLGVENPFYSKEIQKDIHDNLQNYFMENYGVKSPFAIKEIHDKSVKTMMFKNDKFSNEYYSIQDLAEKFNRDISTVAKCINDLNIEYKIGYPNKYYVHNDEIYKLENYFKITSKRITSVCEKELVEFVKSLNIKFIENDRKIISPKELDIYIPSKKVAIEFDGVYFHSELFVDKYFHKNKTNLCNSIGVDLIHVFEDDWKYKRPIVESMIKSRLGIYERKIFARKCEIKEVDKATSRLFLNENHLQGYASTTNLNLGLYYENELVQLISITYRGWHDNNVELTRMVTKLNTQVIGGFSKLVNHFCKNYNCNYLVSYVYNAWFNGKGYLASGFSIVKENPPSYYYVINGKKYHKSNFRKQRLKKLYEDEKIKFYDDNMSESEICRQNKIYRIYDCGTIKVRYKLN